MLFLVEGTVSKTEYMDKESKFKVTRLVEAEDDDQARIKFEEYWRAKTVEYSTYYSASAKEISEVIA